EPGWANRHWGLRVFGRFGDDPSGPAARLEGVAADDLAEGAGPQRAIRVLADRLLEELDRAVAEQEVGAAGVPAAEAELAEVEAGRVVDPAERPDRREHRRGVDPVRL